MITYIKTIGLVIASICVYYLLKTDMALENVLAQHKLSGNVTLTYANGTCESAITLVDAGICQLCYGLCVYEKQEDKRYTTIKEAPDMLCRCDDLTATIDNHADYLANLDFEDEVEKFQSECELYCGSAWDQAKAYVSSLVDTNRKELSVVREKMANNV